MSKYTDPLYFTETSLDTASCLQDLDGLAAPNQMLYLVSVLFFFLFSPPHFLRKHTTVWTGSALCKQSLGIFNHNYYSYFTFLLAVGSSFFHLFGEPLGETGRLAPPLGGVRGRGTQDRQHTLNSTFGALVQRWCRFMCSEICWLDVMQSGSLRKRLQTVVNKPVNEARGTKLK